MTETTTVPFDQAEADGYLIPAGSEPVAQVEPAAPERVAITLTRIRNIHAQVEGLSERRTKALAALDELLAGRDPEESGIVGAFFHVRDAIRSGDTTDAALLAGTVRRDFEALRSS